MKSTNALQKTEATYVVLSYTVMCMLINYAAFCKFLRPWVGEILIQCISVMPNFI